MGRARGDGARWVTRVVAGALLVVMAATARPAELIEEVLVTAAKREQGVYDVPASLSVFDGAGLAERGIADLSAHRAVGARMATYAALQSGYQSGQFPARPYCLFADPDCFTAGNNITALNCEIGVKGQPTSRLEMSAAVFSTRYDDLPYQVSTTFGQGFSTVNLIAEQRTAGVELEGTFHATARFRLSATLGRLDVDVERQHGALPVAPLTPELTLSVSPEYRWPRAAGGEVAARVDYSYRDAMWGEPSSDPGRPTRIGSRSLVNFQVGYTSPDGMWTAVVYGRNAGDERYDNARLNTGDYLLRILSNDASEFGVRTERRL